MRLRHICSVVALLGYCSIANAYVSTVVHPHNVPQNSYTYVNPTLPDPSAFVADLANMCSNNPSGNFCFVRYLAAPVNRSTTHFVIVNTLQCPPNYVVAASFDNRVVRQASPTDLSNPIYYYEKQTLSPVPSMADMMDYQTDGTCAIVQGSAPLSTVSTATDGGCDSTQPYAIVNGQVAQRVLQGTFSQDTYNWGVNKCSHYTLAGCPAWCSNWKWANYAYYPVSCTRPGGFYTTSSTFPSSAASPLYSPSVLICAKPSVGWQPRGSTGG